MEGVVWGPKFCQATSERYIRSLVPKRLWATNCFHVKQYFQGPAKEQLKTKCIKNDSLSCQLNSFEGFNALSASL